MALDATVGLILRRLAEHRWVAPRLIAATSGQADRSRGMGTDPRRSDGRRQSPSELPLRRPEHREVLIVAPTERTLKRPASRRPFCLHSDCRNLGWRCLLPPSHGGFRLQSDVIQQTVDGLNAALEISDRSSYVPSSPIGVRSPALSEDARLNAARLSAWKCRYG